MFITEAIAATETAAAVEPSPMAGFLIQLYLFCNLLFSADSSSAKEDERT